MSSGEEKSRASKLTMEERIFLALDDLNVRMQKLLEQQGKNTWTESFVIAVPAGGSLYQEAIWPFDGRLTQAVLFFPAGPQGTTGVWFTKEDEQLFPPKEGSTIALENIALPYVLNSPVRRGDRVRFNGTNSDAANSHTVRAQLTGVEK